MRLSAFAAASKTALSPASRGPNFMPKCGPEPGTVVDEDAAADKAVAPDNAGTPIIAPPTAPAVTAAINAPVAITR